VWVGNADKHPMLGVSGITGAGPIWHDFMEMAHKNLPVHSFQPPPGLVRPMSALTRASADAVVQPSPQRVVHRRHRATRFDTVYQP